MATGKSTTAPAGKSTRGRKCIEIDQKTFEHLCGMMCTLDEIAGFFECSPDTIERWCKRTYDTTFKEAFTRYSAKGKMSLRRYQFDLAKKNAAMAIFLGKQYLGQTDHMEVVDNTPIERLDEILSNLKSKATASAVNTQNTQSAE